MSTDACRVLSMRSHVLVYRIPDVAAPDCSDGCKEVRKYNVSHSATGLFWLPDYLPDTPPVEGTMLIVSARCYVKYCSSWPTRLCSDVNCWDVLRGACDTYTQSTFDPCNLFGRLSVYTTWCKFYDWQSQLSIVCVYQSSLSDLYIFSTLPDIPISNHDPT